MSVHVHRPEPAHSADAPADAPATTTSLLLSGSPVTQDAMEALFDGLAPVEPEFLLGMWTPGFVNVQTEGVAQTNDQMRQMRWAGKHFRTVDDVDPILVWGEGGKQSYGKKARLREMKVRGTITTAMIYDDVPVIDAFKRVNQNVVLGMMDHRDEQYPRNFMFYLERVK